MSSQDFSQVVRDALDNNPFLETDETAVADVPRPTRPTRTRSHPSANPPWTARGWGAEPIARARLVDGDGVFDTLAAQTSLADHLLGQLNVLPLPERDWALAAAVIESLDDDGYLRTPLRGAAARWCR